MNAFRDRLRVRVMTAHRILDPGLLGEVETSLDEAILECASELLDGSDAELLTFFFAYYCGESWEHVRASYAKSSGTKVSLTAVQQYGRRAVKTIKDNA